MRIFIADSDGGYQQPSRILGRFVEQVARATNATTTVRVQWPAPGVVNPRRSHTWESAAAAGVADLNRLVHLHPSDDVVLIGVCSGARVIYDWMDAHPDSVDRVRAVGMVGDPFRPHDRWLVGTPDPGGQGVAGRRLGPVPERTFWVCVPGDPLSGLEPDSLLCDAVRSSTLAPDQVYAQLLDGISGSLVRLATRLHVGRHPVRWTPALRRRLQEARAALLRFQSLDYAADYESRADGPSPMDRLAAVIAGETGTGAGGAGGPPQAAA